MKNFILVIILCVSTLLKSQSQFQSFIDNVNSIYNPSAKIAAVDSFMNFARSKGIPFIEDSTANFIYNSNVNSVAIAGDFNGWNYNGNQLTKLAGTNFWYKSYLFEMDARLDYKFVINGSSWILDPENPNTCTGGFGPNSELAMPNYVQPGEIEYDPSIMHGKLIYKNIFSSNVNTNYQVTIYLPPNYDSLSNKIYPTAYFQDGTEYISLGKAVNVIDNLIGANKIQPLIGVFVKPNNRNEEYAYSKREQYRLFFVNELVPFIDSSHKTIKDSKKRLVLGDSFGGNISALISFYHPEIFGLCGLHSAAFWVNNYEAYNLILNSEKKDIKFSSIWGTYESLFINMRSFRDFLLTNDYELDWIEKHEGHSWGLWRATLDDMLKFFFPYEPTGIGEDKNYILNEFKLFQNYPNPFNPSTIIEYSIPAVASSFSLSQDVRITIYDILGREVATLVNSTHKPGNYQVEFDASKLSSGVYYYQLTVNVSGEKGTNRFVETKKMVFLE